MNVASLPPYPMTSVKPRITCLNSSFCNRVVSHWNSLSSHIVEDDTVSTFKKRLVSGHSKLPTRNKYRK